VIAIVDYGMGNLRSVEKGFEKAGVTGTEVSNDPERVASADGVVLPGVGAFRDAAQGLRDSGMWDVVLRRVEQGAPLLGICLGMQLLASRSLEDGDWEGLGLIPGVCDRLPNDVKVPHIGWNTVEYPQPSPLFDGVPEGSAFYFVHSYHLVPDEESCIIASTGHGVEVAASVANGRVFGTQFHPEKSSGLGLRVLANFGRIVKEVSA